MVTPARIRAARLIAMTADLLQIGVFPLFSEGFASPLDVALDVLVCGLLTFLVGWHFAFLPGFIAEAVPIVDLVPTWTVAILIATRQKPDSPAATTVGVSGSPPPAPPSQRQAPKLLTGTSDADPASE